MTPAEHQLLALLVQGGRVTREQAAWLQAETARRGAPLAALLAEKGIAAGGAPAPALAATVGAPPPQAQRPVTPPGGVPIAAPLAATVAAAPPPGSSHPSTGPRPALQISAEQLPPDVQLALADPTKRIGRYVLLGELGRGAMGVVVRAYDTVVGRQVAIKLLLDEATHEAIERFKREVAAAGTLRHEAIVALLEVGLHQGRPFLVMELVDGTSLEDLLAAPGGLPLARALPILRQVALALDHAHAKGIIHRDVKPANILVDREGTPRLTDFGIARLATGERLTQTGQVIGTPTTLAPEQAAGERDKHGPPTDVYALGCMLYRAATGRSPFEAGTLQAQLAAVLFEKPVPPRERAPGLDPRLDALVLRCLEKEPAARPTAIDVAAELGRIQAGPPAGRTPVALLAGLAALVVLGSAGAGIAVALRQRGAPPGPGPAPPTEPRPATTAPPATEAPAAATPAGEPRGPAWTSRAGRLVVKDRRGSLAWVNGAPIGRLASTRAGDEVLAVGVNTFRRFDARTGRSVDLDCRLGDAPRRADDDWGREEDWAEGAALTPDGSIAARGDRSGRILLHRRGEPSCALLADLDRPIGTLLFEGDALLAGTDRSLWRIDLATRERTRLADAGGPIMGIARVGARLYFCAGGAVEWLVEGRPEEVIPFERQMTGLTSDGKQLVVTTQQGPSAALIGIPPALEPLALGVPDALGAEFVAAGRVVVVGYPPAGNCFVDLTTRLTTTLQGHVEQVHGVARLADGAVTGGYDGLLFTVNGVGRRQQGPSSRFGRVTSLSVTPDGTQVVSGGNGLANHVWSVAAGSERELTSGAAVVALDDRRVALWSRQLVIVDLAGEQAPVANEGPKGELQGCRFVLPLAPEGVLTCDEAGTIATWTRRAEPRNLRKLGLPIRCGATDAAGGRVLLGLADGRVLLLLLARDQVVPLGQHDGAVLGVSLDGPAGALSVGLDGTLRAWRVDQAAPARWATPALERGVSAVAALGDGRSVTCSRDGSVRLWSPAGAELDRLDLSPVDVPTTVVAARSSRIYVGTSRSLVLAIDVAGP